FSTYSIAYTEKYTVTFDANGGSVTPASAKTNAENKLDTLPTPTRSGSYSFDGWYTSAAGGTEVTTATVFTSDSTIYAHWTNGGSPTIDYTITATADAGGTISPAGKVTVGMGESKSFTITANPDYAISDVNVDGVSRGVLSTYTFTNVTANHTIAATFTHTGGGTTIYNMLTVVKGTGSGNYADGANVSIVADEAPAGWRFKAWELTSGGGTLANANSASTTFTMPAGAATVTATYARLTGELTVSKTVTGGGNTNALFTFRFTFSEAGPYAYTGSKHGSIGSGGSIQLKHGESVTITIPQGVTYTVIEDAAAKYIPTPQNRTYTGKIAATPGAANFENRYNDKYVPPEPTLTGSLTVKKNVTGNLGDKNKEFAFSVTFNAAGYYSYIGSKSGVIQSGDTVWLCHGESVNILNLPAGTAYSVTERGNSGYRVYASGDTGVIVANGVSTAAFTNSRSSVPQTGEDNSLLGGVLMMVCAILGAAALLVLNGRIRSKRRGA
ncbi:MAG: InlB B-repeat-containing protein, partial [Citrobacter sp.]